MNKFLFLLLFYVYFCLVDYFSKMILFDFKKYILKDKYLIDIKFSYNWQEKYAEKKVLEKFEQMKEYSSL